MAHKRVKSSRFPGVYWRETTDTMRKHNGRPDRCYDYCIRIGGKLKWVCVGWASEGFSEQKAANMRRDALAQAARGTEESNEDKARLTLNEAADLYFDWLKSEGKYDDPERARYDSNVRDGLGIKLLGDISDDDVTSFKSGLLNSMTEGAAVRQLGTLRAAINHAVKRKKWAGINPFSKARMDMPRPQNWGERFLTAEEARKLLAALELRSPQLHDMAWLSLKTGLRCAEIFRLTGADADRTAGVLWVTEKGRTRVAVRVGNEVLNLLESYGRKPHEYIFQARDGSKITKTSDTFDRVCVDLGLMPKDPEERANMDRRKRVWFHTLRHTFASWLAQSGKVTLYELRDLLRHSSITQTERYAHLIPSTVQKKAAMIDEILEGQNEEGPAHD